MTDPKPRTLDSGPGFVRAKECPDCGHTKCGESCVCNCDAARAEAEADSLRAQLEEARGISAYYKKQISDVCETLYVHHNIGLKAEEPFQGVKALAEKFEAALTAAQGEVAQLTADLEEARKDLAAGVRGLKDLASMVGPREAGWSDVWSSVELLKRERDASQGEVAVLRAAISVMVPTCLRSIIMAHKEKLLFSDIDAAATQQTLDRVEAALASTRATSVAHDERVRREALEEAEERLGRCTFSGALMARDVVRALAHPTKEKPE